MKMCSVRWLFAFACLTAGVSFAFETASPEAEGVSSRAVLEWVNAVEHDLDAVHGFVLVRHGKIVAEGWWTPYAKDRPHMLFSLSKSFTSTAIGMAVDEGKLHLDDKVVSFFPDRLPASPSENLKAMRVRDLLCMGSGHGEDTIPAIRKNPTNDWVATFLAQPVDHRPGTYFRYNTGATYVLSAILQKATGERLLDYLTPRLFAPLDIRDATWELSPQGIHTGGYGLKLTTRDIAAFGQFYLQKGEWNGKRLLSASWIDLATSKQIDNGSKPDSDWCQGYGFQFWRCRHNAFRGDGAFGQYCLVMPDQDAVLAVNSGLGDMQGALNSVWTHLLPGLKSAALPADPAAQAELTAKLSSLTLRPIQGAAESPRAAEFVGKTYVFGDNEKGLQTLSLAREGDGYVVRLRNVHGDQRIDCGNGQWKPGSIIFEKELVVALGETNGRQAIAAAGAWAAPDRYVADVVFCETPFRLKLTLNFDGDRVTLDANYNVRFGAKTWQSVGRLVAVP